MTTKHLLTEDEILKMDEQDYMNGDQLAFFKDRLAKVQEEFQRNAGQLQENLSEPVIMSDPVGRQTIEEERARELGVRDSERRLLKEVLQALTRINSGEYGWCEESGKPIGLPRLLASPTETLSLEARQRQELK